MANSVQMAVGSWRLSWTLKGVMAPVTLLFGALEPSAAAKPTRKMRKKESPQAKRRYESQTTSPPSRQGLRLARTHLKASRRSFFGGINPTKGQGWLLSSPSSATPQHPSPRDPLEGPHAPWPRCQLCWSTRRAGRVQRDRCTVNWIWLLRQKGWGLGHRGGITGGGRSCPQGLLCWGIIGGG